MIGEVLTMTSSATARSARLATAAALTGGIQMFRRAATELRGLIAGALPGSYRPELHYMRGPGPKWRERHPAAQRDDHPANCKIEPALMTARQGWPRGMNLA
jgi:hypothetical protein